MARPKILADQGCGGVAQPPGGQYGEDDDANSNGVAGQGGRTEEADDTDQADPARLADQELQNAGDGYAYQAP